MIKFSIPKLIALTVFLATTACVGTKQVEYGQTTEEMPSFNRTVEYRIDDQLFWEAPDCVTVLPIDTIGHTSYTKTHVMVEEAIARHLGDYISHIINPYERDNLTRSMAVDLTHPADRASFSRQTKCKYFLELTPINKGNAYLVFWSQSALGLDVRLTDVTGKKDLWQARHVASRSDGGVPLSPISAAYNAFNASLLSNDSDIPHSLADDLARRLTATLPDMRQSSQITIYN